MNDTPQAFPTLERGAGGLELTDAGMSLRDYFAAKAMHALVVEPPWSDGGIAQCIRGAKTSREITPSTVSLTRLTRWPTP